MSLSLVSERLSLTPLAVGDVDVVIEMFTNPVVTKFIGGVMSEADIRQDIPLWTKRGGDGGIGIWCISNRATGEKYGSVFLLPMPIREDDTDWARVMPGVMPDGDVEIGFNLKETAWGQGHATEACRRLLRFAFEQTPLEEIVATLDDDHVASRRVLEKSGLSHRGRRWAYGQEGPDWRIGRSEWLASVAQGR
ncbi:MAG: GNAT family N-acetyltransferase [Methyloligellaceae bacterium]